MSRPSLASPRAVWEHIRYPVSPRTLNLSFAAVASYSESDADIRDACERRHWPLTCVSLCTRITFPPFPNSSESPLNTDHVARPSLASPWAVWEHIRYPVWAVSPRTLNLSFAAVASYSERDADIRDACGRRHWPLTCVSLCSREVALHMVLHFSRWHLHRNEDKVISARRQKKKAKRKRVAYWGAVVCVRGNLLPFHANHLRAWIGTDSIFRHSPPADPDDHRTHGQAAPLCQCGVWSAPSRRISRTAVLKAPIIPGLPFMGIFFAAFSGKGFSRRSAGCSGLAESDSAEAEAHSYSPPTTQRTRTRTRSASAADHLCGHDS
uniref:Uncharacterized protein n=1 Tax=Mycena chlorophos TaxID=658473 RepID=A0ABQ0MAH9_MYCCL|nr:predicted protein [Mycena chlorophos]